MEITVTEPGKVALVGDATIYTAAAFKDTVFDHLQNGERLDLDLSKIAEIDSAGLQVLMMLKRESALQGKALRLTSHSKATVDLIELYDMASFFGDPLVIAAKEPPKRRRRKRS